VEVAPITVAYLAQAQATGNLSLSLRGTEDETEAGQIEVDLSDIIGKVETVVQKERVCTIKVRKGAEVVEIPADCPPE
jgi:pilus assembly protein CpaB